MNYNLKKKELNKKLVKITNLSKMSIASIGTFVITGSIATSSMITDPSFAKFGLIGLSIAMIAGSAYDYSYKKEELRKIKNEINNLYFDEVTNIQSRETDIEKETEKILKR